MGEQRSFPAVFRFLFEEEVYPERFGPRHPFASGYEVMGNGFFDFVLGGPVTPGANRHL